MRRRSASPAKKKKRGQRKKVRKKRNKKNQPVKKKKGLKKRLFLHRSSSKPTGALSLSLSLSFSRGVVGEARAEGVVLVHRLLQHRAEVPDDHLRVGVDAAVADLPDLEALSPDRRLVALHLGEAVVAAADPLPLVHDAVVEADAQRGRDGVAVAAAARRQGKDVEVKAPGLPGLGVAEGGDAEGGAVDGAPLVLFFFVLFLDR